MGRVAEVTTVIRFIGIVNAAIWLGAAVFVTIGVAPAFFGEEMKALLGPSFPAWSGALVQVVFKRFFLLNYVCGGIAVVHLLAEWLYQGKPIENATLGLLAGLLLFSLAGGMVMQPRLSSLHRIKYSPSTPPDQRLRAAGSLRVWHGVSQTANLIMLGGLFVYFWRTASKPDAVRFLSSNKFQ